MVRTRFAPSPTGFMHIGNLRTALYEYLVAKKAGGTFILRIEDTDQERIVEGSVDVIYKTLKMVGLYHDEGPDVGGAYGPYVQSQRKSNYLDYAKQLVEKGAAYYCFCTKEELAARIAPSGEGDAPTGYDRHCSRLSKEEVEAKLLAGVPFVIRQKIPSGKTTFHDHVFGDITVDNSELDDQVLIKSDLMPTYNFANVVDDHLMEISHVVRGSEYLSSTPKYNLLYEAFGWEIPEYIHLPLIINSEYKKLSKRRGDASFEDLVQMGFLPNAIINFIALLGWSPSENREFFTLEELTQAFDVKGLSKSPAVFDMEKLTWMNGEYIKKLPKEEFYQMALPHLKEHIKRTDLDLEWVAELCQSRVSLPREVSTLVDYLDTLPQYEIDLFFHKKMKSTPEISLTALKAVLPVLEALDGGKDNWVHEKLYESISALAQELQLKNGQMLWPIRVALSGKPASFCGATELLQLLGKEDCLNRIRTAITMLDRV